MHASVDKGADLHKNLQCVPNQKEFHQTLQVWAARYALTSEGANSTLSNGEGCRENTALTQGEETTHRRRQAMTHTDQVRALVVLLVLNNLFTDYESSIEYYG